MALARRYLLPTAVVVGLGLSTLIGSTGIALAATAPQPAGTHGCPDGYTRSTSGYDCTGNGGGAPYGMPTHVKPNPYGNSYGYSHDN